jgi:hypothetical protein
LPDNPLDVCGARGLPLEVVGAAGGGVATDTGVLGLSTGVIDGRLLVLYCDADTYLL